MLALRAIPVIVHAAAPQARAPHPILASILPALDTAFGLEPAVLFPDRIAALVERLTAAFDAAPTFVEVEFLEAA